MVLAYLLDIGLLLVNLCLFEFCLSIIGTQQSLVVGQDLFNFHVVHI